jgi:hypothetical protein
MIHILIKIIGFNFLIACASFHGETGRGVTQYKPATIGPQMDIDSLRADAMNRVI